MSEWKDKDEMPFGKYRGEKLGDVPASYLLWCAEQEGLRTSYPGLVTYVETNRRHLEKEESK